MSTETSMTPMLDALRSGKPVPTDDIKPAFTLVDGFHASDVGNAYRLHTIANGTIRFVETWKCNISGTQSRQWTFGRLISETNNSGSHDASSMSRR